MKKTGIYLCCQKCNSSFYASRWWINKGSKFCSRNCYWKSKRGSIPWNKGIKGTHFSPETEFKKGQFINEKHPLWRGENVSYSGLHYWVKRKLGSPKICIKCGGSRFVEWANRSHEYKRDLDDWMQLCASCHDHYDRVGYWGVATKKYARNFLGR